MKTPIVMWLLLAFFSASAQISEKKSMRIMCYNVENFFDCVDDTTTHDEEYLPGGMRGWNYQKYQQKQANIGKVITALGGWEAPALVGLCEVESERALRDLTIFSGLKSLKYKFIHYESPDARGVDVALLYQPSSFALIQFRSIRIKPLPDTRPTRDILYASGRIMNDDTLHVFVLHAPSRRGGEQVSRPYRLQVASQLVSAVDSIYALNDSARIIVAGDFNDYSDSPALRYLYQHHLINISVGVKGSHGAKATYRWHGDWRSLDQILFSPSLSRLKMSCQIGDLPFLLEDDEKYGGKKPFRTYLGPRYLGGYSDHLPLVAKFKIEGGYE